MKYTNKLGLPKVVVEAIKQDDRDYDDYTFSVTEILNPTRIIWLKKRHKDEIEVDVSSMIWAMLGTATHYITDQYSTDESITEERLSKNIEGMTITGQFDLYENKVLYDLKTTSMWTKVYGYREEWEQQLNIYRYLLNEAGFEVEELKIIAIYRDWSKYQGMKQGIPNQVDTINIPMWRLDETEYFIRERLIEIKAMRDLKDENLPLCTPEQRWANSTQYAVKKPGRKSAVKLWDNMAEAQKDAAKRGKGHYVEIRQGKDKRCIDYCDCKEFCSYYKENYGGK